MKSLIFVVIAVLTSAGSAESSANEKAQEPNRVSPITIDQLTGVARAATPNELDLAISLLVSSSKKGAFTLGDGSSARYVTTAPGMKWTLEITPREGSCIDARHFTAMTYAVDDFRADKGELVSEYPYATVRYMMNNNKARGQCGANLQLSRREKLWGRTRYEPVALPITTTEAAPKFSRSIANLGGNDILQLVNMVDPKKIEWAAILNPKVADEKLLIIQLKDNIECVPIAPIVSDPSAGFRFDDTYPNAWVNVTKTKSFKLFTGRRDPLCLDRIVDII